MIRYKVIDYISNGFTEVETGTCELCFGVSFQNDDVLVVEDDNKNRIEITLNDWDWGDLTNYEINNLIGFTDWISKQEFDKELSHYDFLNLVDRYNDEEVEENE